MKPSPELFSMLALIRLAFVSIVGCAWVTASGLAQSNQTYTVSLPGPGVYSLIANQLDHGSNTTDILFPNQDRARVCSEKYKLEK